MFQRLRDTSLSLRLTALYVAILAAVLAVLGFVLYSQVQNFLLNDTRDRITAGAQQAIMRVPKNGRDQRNTLPDIGRLIGITSELSSRDTVARIFTADGTILVGGQSIPEQPEPPACSPADLQRAI